MEIRKYIPSSILVVLAGAHGYLATTMLISNFRIPDATPFVLSLVPPITGFFLTLAAFVGSLPRFRDGLIDKIDSGPLYWGMVAFSVILSVGLIVATLMVVGVEYTQYQAAVN